MKRHCVQESYYAAPLSVVKGYKEEQGTIQQMVNACWLAAYTAIWNGIFFSGEEEAKAKAAIKMILINSVDLETGYREFIQRLLLSRRYLRTDIEALRQSPEEWFSEYNKRGFCRSAFWYAALQYKRKQNPGYCLGLKAFADAVLEMTEEPGSKTYHYWRDYFVERRKHGLLNLFLGVVACLRR